MTDRPQVFEVEMQSKPGGRWSFLYGPYDDEATASEVAKKQAHGFSVSTRVVMITRTTLANYSAKSLSDQSLSA